MRRPFLMAIVATLALGAGAALAARQANEAWLLLTTGERVDGLVTSSQGRGGFGQFFERDGFAVDEGSGRITRIPTNQVALIDFTTQRPPASELLSLPESGQVLVLSNGSIRPGQLIELTPTTVRWQPVRGSAMNVPARDIRRIYLNLDRAYQLAQGTGAWGQRRAAGWARGRGGTPAGQPGTGGKGEVDDGPSGGKAGSGGSVSGGKAGGGGSADGIAVLADQPWTDTGIGVRVGQMVRFEADGRVIFSLGNENITGPGGVRESGPSFPVPSLGIGGLIGKIGPTGRPFAIGTNRNPIRMPATGRLMLGVNDDHYDDNSGAFRVTVIR